MIGVGTQTKIASASAMRGIGRRDDAQPAVERGAEPRVVDVVDRRGPGLELGDAAGRRVDAFDLEPGLEKEMASGRPT